MTKLFLTLNDDKGIEFYLAISHIVSIRPAPDRPGYDFNGSTILPIFEAYHFETLPTIHNAPPVTDPKHLYLCADEVQVAAYFEECDKAHRAHGFTGPQGHCPALTAEYLVIRTEQALIDLAKPLFGIEDVYGDDRKRYLELLIGACIKAESEAA